MNNKILEVILESLGEASVEFMSQGDTMAKHIIMPAKELEEIAIRTEKRITSILNK